MSSHQVNCYTLRARRGARKGFSLVELLVTIGVTSVILALLLPAVQSVRESSRASNCRNNFHQLVRACQEHEAVRHEFPYTSTSAVEPDPHGGPRSPFVEMMHWLDPAVAKQFDPTEQAIPVWDLPAPGQYSNSTNRELQALEIEVLNCPSDGPRPGGTNYRASVGLSAMPLRVFLETLPESPFGAFEHRRSVRPAEFLDGLSHTVMFSERVYGGYQRDQYFTFRDVYGIGAETTEAGFLLTADERIPLCRQWARTTPSSHYPFLGGMWILGGYLNSWYLHALPPNSVTPDCLDGPGCTDGGYGVISARSFHPGCVQIAVSDGSVRPAADSIDLRVWRALGTRAASD